MIKPNRNILKEKFSFIDNAFGWFQNTKIGKYYFRGTSFYKILLFFGSILVAQISAYTNLMSLVSKVNIQLENSEGLAYAGWFILSLIVPEGNLFLITVLIFIIFGAWSIRNKELTEKTIEDGLLKPLREKAKTFYLKFKQVFIIIVKKLRLIEKIL